MQFDVGDQQRKRVGVNDRLGARIERLRSQAIDANVFSRRLVR
jgi:hypothetical protein